MEPISTTVWLFTIYCTAQCPWFADKKKENHYFNSSSYEGCVSQAQSLIKIDGLVGTWEIECKPYPLKIIARPAQGN